MASDSAHNQQVASDGDPAPAVTTMDPIQPEPFAPQSSRQWIEADTSNNNLPSAFETPRRFSQRLSFFGRSSSDASKPPATFAPTTTPSNRGVDGVVDQQRPSTAHSESKRRTADHFESIRNSLFGGRKLATSDRQSNALRASSRDQQRSKFSRKSQSLDRSQTNSSLLSLSSQGDSNSAGKDGQFNSANEYYRHRKKSSISPPFNFQHITHTAKKHLPKLETVDEKDLAAKFWAVSVQQKPKQQLTGIKAEHLENPQNRSLSPTARPRTSPRAARISRPFIGAVDETTFDETYETKFNPDDAYQTLEDVHDANMIGPPNRPLPKPNSSMGAVDPSATHAGHRQLRGQASFDESYITRAPARLGPPRARTSILVTPTEDGRPLHRNIYDKELPSIPQEEAARKDSKLLLDNEAAARYSMFPAPPGQNADSPTVAKSKRPSLLVATLGSQKTGMLNEGTWEDDIDFAYEQEAEAMCDFDWEGAPSVRSAVDEFDSPAPSGQPSSEESSGAPSPNGGIRLSNSVSQPSTFASATPSSSRERSSSVATSNLSSTENNHGHHRRGSSVGHRGFQASRKTSTDGTTKTSPSLALALVPEVSMTTPPPTFSLTDADVDKPKKATNDGAYFPTLDVLMPGYLSDPESSRTGGSRHRKSSSYGSYRSSVRSLLLGSDTTRWSSTSSSSLPDLHHGKRKSRSSVAKGRHSRPLESVPPSPKFGDGRHEDKLTVPSQHPLWDKEQLDPTFMRRPSSPGDRQVLYSAGRFVQRGRSSTACRLAQRLTCENETGWI